MQSTSPMFPAHVNGNAKPVREIHAQLAPKAGPGQSASPAPILPAYNNTKGATWTGQRHSPTARSRRLPPPPSPQPTIITTLPQHLNPSILRNALLLVDKPPDWEAAEVVKALKWATRAPHVIHGGSLDTPASGLMIICFGEASRLTQILHRMDKAYSGSVEMGLATDTGDATGRGTAVLPWRDISDASIQQVAADLLGEQLQLPPTHTAERGTGKQLYRLFDALSPDSIIPRSMVVHALELEREPGSQMLTFQLRATRCGYVRALAHEIGWRLRTAAHLTTLRRTGVGPFRIADAWTLDVLLPLLRRYRGK